MTECIYCKNGSVDTKGVAHIVPEALFKNETVLPKGMVCDSCNNYLGQLDNTLILHNHIWPIIQMCGFLGKNGKARQKIGYMERGNGNSSFSIHVDQVAIKKLVLDKEGVHVEVRNPTGFNDLRFRRALHHIAFNFLAFIGPGSLVMEDRFDIVRHYIRNPSKDDKWPYLQAVSDPSAQKNAVEVKKVDSESGLIILVHIFSDDFYVDLLNSGRLVQMVDTFPDLKMR